MHTANSILVIRLSAMGDVAMVATTIREAALSHPDICYTLLSRTKMKALLDYLPNNVRFVAYGDKIDWHLYDQVVDAHSVWRSWRIDAQALWHHVRVRCIHKPRIARWLYTHFHVGRVPTMYTLYRALLALEPISTQPISANTVAQRKDIGIAPFAAHQGKIYPLDKMERIVQAMGEYLNARQEKVLLFGAGEKEENILQQWEQKYLGVECVAGKGTLQQELDTISHLRLMLTMDSGNMHFASLVNTRVVSIWGATHPNTGFLGYGQSQEDCIQRNLKCRPCSIYGKKLCKYKDYRCMDIDPGKIIEHISHILCTSN